MAMEKGNAAVAPTPLQPISKAWHLATVRSLLLCSVPGETACGA